MDHFVLIQGSNAGLKSKVPLIGKAYLNLAEFASFTEEKEFELNIPLVTSSGANEPHPSLHVRTLKVFCNVFRLGKTLQDRGIFWIHIFAMLTISKINNVLKSRKE